MRRAATDTSVGATWPKEPIMTTSPHVSGHPHLRPHDASMSSYDWAEAVAVGFSLFTAVVVLTGMLTSA
jgi:hypothetical protein